MAAYVVGAVVLFIRASYTGFKFMRYIREHYPEEAPRYHNLFRIDWFWGGYEREHDDEYDRLRSIADNAWWAVFWYIAIPTILVVLIYVLLRIWL
jgi:hypothetical protein